MFLTLLSVLSFYSKAMAEARERTFIMIKPDGVHRGLVGKIIKRFEAKGFKLVAMKFMWADKALLEKHYADLAGRPFFPGLVEYMSSGPVVPMVWEGLNVVKTGRVMLGATNPADSVPGSIRGDLCIQVGRNICHGSDAVESANKEIALWFGEKELVNWQPYPWQDLPDDYGKDGFSRINNLKQRFPHLKGAPPSKIVVGLPFYGRTFVSELEGKLGDSADSQGFKGPYSNEHGFMGYNEICSSLQNSSYDWKTEWHDESSQMVARYTDPVTRKGHSVTYDTTRSIANKIKFITRKELAGAMCWSIDTDDFKGSCPEENDTYADFGQYPGVKLNIPTAPKGSFKLLKTINEAMQLASVEWQQEKDIEFAKKQAELDKQNEIPHKETGNTASSLYKTVLPILLVLLPTIVIL
uniref:Nucleoside diphosphate kinase n=1 Tax=Culicoides sonorensis TaxID=179676 RepID=A0A336LTH1_CULSO